ncbi:F0F1 ATP synthase subunit B [Candidatus Tachikawaea gelatinosa]|uniref:ATP synthase subunit b n=1 Tax=Candidatus Tachikawaea gelatinosa TaxID=1410383 RepID=A0A090APP4_9ENTR|nr:F0F1 ATP synthase subunit B [Candidatus Tachikawaea gelatinosa]BAP58267.1 ATP synthase subunit b [Candidatus Tachikawaea gelatinosa]
MNINATILGQSIAFFIFLIFCAKYIWPPIINTIEKRQKNIIKEFESIANTKKKLTLKKIGLNETIQKSKEDAKDIILKAQILQQEILEEAKKKAVLEYHRIIKKAHIEINNEKLKLQEELQKNTICLIINSVKKIMTNYSMDHVMNNQMIKKTIKDL